MNDALPGSSIPYGDSQACSDRLWGRMKAAFLDRTRGRLGGTEFGGDRMRRLVFVGLLAASLFRPAAAAADGVTLTNTGPSSSYQGGWSVGEGGWVNISFGSTTETGWAGEINWLVNGAQSVVTYCADLFDNALQTQTGMTVSNSSPLTSASGEVAWLVNTY